MESCGEGTRYQQNGPFVGTSGKTRGSILLLALKCQVKSSERPKPTAARRTKAGDTIALALAHHP